MKLTNSGINAWYMDDLVDVDQRLPHKKEINEPASIENLNKIGVHVWKLSGEEEDSELEEIRQQFDFNYKDMICVSPDRLPNYEEKIKMFFEEHLHTDPEVRYIVDGSGYFDVRDFNEKWIRIEVLKGHLLTLPEGIFHRFTLDDKNYIKAIRLFKGEPVWTPHNRSSEVENFESRIHYVEAYSS